MVYILEVLTYGRITNFFSELVGKGEKQTLLWRAGRGGRESERARQRERERNNRE